MNIIIQQTLDNNSDTRQRLIIDGEEELDINPLWETPEDAIIERDLVDCKQITSLMRKAWLAGLRGEKFNISTQNIDYEEWR